MLALNAKGIIHAISANYLVTVIYDLSEFGAILMQPPSFHEIWVLRERPFNTGVLSKHLGGFGFYFGPRRGGLNYFRP